MTEVETLCKAKNEADMELHTEYNCITNRTAHAFKAKYWSKDE
jgi:hypothetical protein